MIKIKKDHICLFFFIYILGLTYTMEKKEQFIRLPTNVQPIHYELSLTPNIENFTYSARQKIFINVIEPTKSIILHSVELKITSVSYHSESQFFQHSQNVKYNVPEETITIEFSDEIPSGKNGFISLEFHGEIREQLNGLYRSKYTSNNVTKYAALTQFAPTDARRCFPCWDEPAIKSTFDISLTVPKNFIALSNMPIKKTVNQTESNLKTVSFQKTPIMSTYLVVLMVCEYDFIENNNVNNTIIRVYAPKNKIEQGKFGLGVATKALLFYNSYFNIPFPLPKIDLVSVEDFSFGAMENWGLITFREDVVLVDTRNSSTSVKQSVALTIAHEMAHQWFGNLVTMEWWTHLWLNEGYASFMEYLCVDNLYPEYNIWTQFLTTAYLKALELDALANTHPIEIPIENPSEITEIFDDISYSKGASVIRMIHNYIGDDDFRKGMTLYLNKHSYSNVKTEDLWYALEKVCNKPVGKIMSSWTKQPGFPLITISEKDSNDSNNRVLTFLQERFYINGSIDKSNSTWMVPIAISSALDPKQILEVIILDEKTKDVEIKGVERNSWIKINVGSVGLFRTLYSDDLLALLISGVENQTLPIFDRLNLLDDLFATAQAGRISTVKVLKLLEKFKNENDYTIWSCIIRNLIKISNILIHLKDTNLKFKIFGKNLLLEIYSKLGWVPREKENHLEALLRIKVLSQLVDFDDEIVINEAQRLFHMHINKQSILPPDFRSFVYRAVLSVGNSDTFEQMLSLYKDTEMHEEKNRILSSLGAVKDPNILQRILEFSLSQEVRSQETARAINSVVMNHQGKLLAWQYFKNNSKKFINRCQSGTTLTRIVKDVTQNFVSEEIIKDIKEFFEQNPISGTERTIQQSIETIKLNVAWLNREKDSIEEFLKSL